MRLPSRIACGSPSIRVRSLNVPGSPSSALTTRYRVSPSRFGVSRHLRPAGKPAPPRPRSPLCSTISVTWSGVRSLSTRVAAWYPPVVRYASIDARPGPRCFVRIGSGIGAQPHDDAVDGLGRHAGDALCVGEQHRRLLTRGEALRHLEGDPPVRRRLAGSNGEPLAEPLDHPVR